MAKNNTPIFVPSFWMDKYNAEEVDRFLEFIKGSDFRLHNLDAEVLKTHNNTEVEVCEVIAAYKKDIDLHHGYIIERNLVARVVRDEYMDINSRFVATNPMMNMELERVRDLLEDFVYHYHEKNSKKDVPTKPDIILEKKIGKFQHAAIRNVFYD